MDEQQEIIKLFIENEKVLSELYLTYSNKFPEKKDFWKKIAEEEGEHIKWISFLNDKVLKGEVHFNDDRFEAGALRTFVAYIKEEISNAENNDVNPLVALGTSLDAEKALLERKYFEIFDGDSTKIKNLLSKLEKATEEHIKYIEEELKKEKFSQ